MKINNIDIKDLEISFEMPNDRNKKDLGISSGIIWANKKGNNCHFPILYLKKPKGIRKDDFKALLENIEISL